MGEALVDAPPPPPPLHPRPRPLAVLGDAAFLACSWTWCIGMFLPVLLVRDLGPWAWVVFAVPNCVGAAAFAWWFRTRESSARFVSVHADAVRLFSLVTLAFQWFFAAWAIRLLGLSMLSLGLVLAFIAIFFIAPRSMLMDGPRRSTAIALWLASLLLGGTWLVSVGGAAPNFAALPPPLLPAGDLIPLALVCVLGFACSPLLDGTFHTLRQRSASTSARPEFALGFLVLFASMILLTLLYAPGVITLAHSEQVTIRPAGLSWWILGHVAIQLAYTIAAHERWLSRSGQPGSGPVVGPWPAATAIASISGLLLGIGVGLVRLPDWMPGASTSEVVYRLFMAFYGLVVPLYVLGCAVPMGSKAPGVSMPRLAVLCIGLVSAAPFYWEGFIARKTPMLFVGVGIVVVAGLLARLFTHGPAEGGGSGSPDSREHPPRSGGPVPARTDPSRPVLSGHARP